MNYFKLLIFLLFGLISCKSDKKNETSMLQPTQNDFVISFGSCNNQSLPNEMWKEITKNNPDIWIWGGDIIYSDTEDMAYMEQNYSKQKSNVDYAYFRKNTEILATWDDHDYGLNDGGGEYVKKAEAQHLFLDFMDVPKNDKRRTQKGIYFAKDYTVNNKSIKVILLDTRYFRTALTPDTESEKRYKPNAYGKGSILGKTQWKWLEEQLKNSKASFNIIVSSIQFLSAEHGFESWGNMPHEVENLENLLKTAKTKNTIILSGDRHLSEISKKTVNGLNYPLIDFTSSGLTHAYASYTNEPNQYRIGKIIPKKSFGLLKFNLKNNSVTMEIRGKDNVVYKTYTQNY